MSLDTTPPWDDVQNYVDGEWRAPSGEDGQNVIDPATGETLARVGFSSEADIDAAVDAGRDAFEEWR